MAVQLGNVPQYYLGVPPGLVRSGHDPDQHLSEYGHLCCKPKVNEDQTRFELPSK